MNIVSAGLILVFCFVGAVVALLADNMGRAIGKKRLSIFRMRPKHTATVFITLAGFLIPLITTAMLAFSSQDLRTILREGSQLISERDRVQAGLVTAKSDLSAAKSDLTKLQRTADQIEAQRIAAEKQLKTARTDLGQRQARIKELQTQGGALRARLGSLQSTVNRVQSTLASLRTQSGRLQQENGVFASNLRVLKRDIVSYNTQLSKVNAEVDSLTREARRLDTEKTQAREDLRLAQAEFDRQFELTGKQLAEKESLIRDAEARLTDIEVQARALEEKARQLRENAGVARVGGLIYSMNDEVVRRELPAAMTYPEADAAIAEALRSAAKSARERGAADSILYKAADFHTIGEGERLVTPERQRTFLREEMVRQSEPMVLILSAVWNSFKGESVPLRYSLRANRVIYQPGAIIAETRIEGDRSEREVLDTMTQWLATQLPFVLDRDGVIPVAGRGDPFGQVSQARVLELAQEIRAQNRRIRLQVLASGAIRSAGPVRFELRLR
ncbi:MAG: DUF3084 domain-containing protein [Chthonomonas sp.]|nr:DUF3084 domain-containing protein [Chthonomonas sp.]